MANEWRVIKDEHRFGKRFVEIEDTVNKFKYSNYFKLSATDTQVLARFRQYVKESRAERARQLSGLNLTNFEATL